MRVRVDGRPLDSELRQHGIGRYAQGLLGQLGNVAEERGGELTVLRRRGLFPLAVRGGVAVHHSLSLYGTPLASRAPVVVTMHDVVPLQWPDEYLRTGLRHRTLYRAVRRAAAGSVGTK